MTIDISILWDFNNPGLSEECFLSALSNATPDDVLILQTQIARTYGIRGDFSRAQQILSETKSKIQDAGIEVKVHYHLELGRTYSSATHSPESQTDETKQQARSAFMRAYKLAQEGKLEWNRKAMALMQSSAQQDAKKWAGSLHNNTGYALHLLERYEEALDEFKLALAAREQDGDPQKIRIAYWMIAWTLRALGQLNEAIEIQLRLEKESDEAGEPDPYVFEELEILYKAINNNEKAEYYAARRKATT